VYESSGSQALPIVYVHTPLFVAGEYTSDGVGSLTSATEYHAKIALIGPYVGSQPTETVSVNDWMGLLAVSDNQPVDPVVDFPVTIV
jgi:hypothetical protein